MFKSWRSDKKKIKAVFKLQFQATQVPQLKKPALVISLVPEDVGKTTFKLEKAAVKEGICLWENPIFVTVKLIKHQKTGKLNEKIYHFIVSSGSSKSGYLGEASIDFAELAEETQPLTVSLPLKFANSGAVLHVTVQRLHEGTDQRYVEDNGDSLSQDDSLNNRLSIGNANGDNSFTEDVEWDDLLAENAEPGNSFKGSNASILSSTRQNSMPQKVTKNRLHKRSSTEWSMGSASDGSLIDSTNSPDDSLPRELPVASDESIESLKNEITSLMRQSELSELELQALRKQITKENKRAQDLSRLMIELNEERDTLKSECVQLRSQQKCVEGEALNRLRAENKDVKVQLEEIMRELSQEKELNNNLKLQLQKTQDSNSELILAVNDLDEMLEQKKLEISESVGSIQNKKCKCNGREDEDQLAAREQEELARQENDASELCVMKQKITELNEEIEQYREDTEKLENYIKQLTRDYADLEQKNLDISSKLEQQSLQNRKMQNESTEYLARIKDLESDIEKLEEKLQKQTHELSESLDSINELESEVKLLEKELEKQAQEFEIDLDATTSAKVEQEQRAIVAEEALRKTRWKNSVTAERLQEEFKRLSTEMAGKLDENEKQMREAIEEANELRVQNGVLEGRLQKANEEISLMRDRSGVRVEELSFELDLKTKCIEKMSLELEDTSLQLRSAKKHVEEKEEALSLEIQMLNTKIERLTEEKNELSEKAEHLKLKGATVQSKSSVEDTKTLIERWNTERDELERKFALARKEAEKAQKELLILKSSKVEKETLVQKLSSEAKGLRSQHTELKNSLSKGEVEKQNLKKQVQELKHELQKRKEGGNSTPRARHEHAAISEANSNSKSDKKWKTAGNAKTTDDDSVTSLKRDDCKLTELVTEVALLKERNKSMESELKDMEERYSEISLKFAEVEGERQQLVMTVRNLKSGKRN
ncbi:Myosin heavy chain-related protein [Euphorbia peplus]|nr:Myosin heavy chain-related protein [Euphorbia peplus]